MQSQKDDPLVTFTTFLNKVNSLNLPQILEKTQQIYAVRQFKVTQLTSVLAGEMYQNIYIKFNRNLTPKSELNWWENELRIFVWALILYVEINNTQVENLNQKDWEFFSLLFPNKKQILFEYQSLNILKEHGQAKKWVSQEDEIFSGLVNQKGLKCKWSQLAKLLYIQSEKKFFRTPKQCRQRWLNHLDPSKSKTEWSIREDYILIRYVYQKEKRWAEISKLLDNKRNQHSIKNRFKSLMTKEQKYHKEKLDEKELIYCVYKRYQSYCSRLSSTQIDEKGSFFSGFKSDVQKRPSTAEHPSMLLSDNQENLSNYNPFKYGSSELLLKSSSGISPREKLMFPFAFYTGNGMKKDNREERGGYNMRMTSMEELAIGQGNPQRAFQQAYGNQSREDVYGMKYRSEQFLPQSHFNREEDRYENNHHGKNEYLPMDNVQEYEGDRFYSALLDQNFNQLEDLPLGCNYEQFLPMFTQDNEAESEMIFKEEEGDNQNEKVLQVIENRNDLAERKQQMDDEEKRIRAQILLEGDPLQMVRKFFYRKKGVVKQQ